METIKFFRSKFGLSEGQLDQDQALKTQIEQLSKCLQGYPLRLQLAVGNLNYVGRPCPSSLLQKDLAYLVQQRTGATANELMD